MVSLSTASAPSLDELEDIIFSARYGELEELQDFHKKYGPEALAGAQDERGNTCLHMAAANGHQDVVSFLLPFYSSEQLEAGNNVGNTALHWAASNGHLAILRLLVPALPKSALFLQNKFGKTALSEAEGNVPAPKEGEPEQSEEERAKNKHIECAGYLLTFMELGAKEDEDKEGEGEDSEPLSAQSDQAGAEVASSVEKMALDSSSQSGKTEISGR